MPLPRHSARVPQRDVRRTVRAACLEAVRGRAIACGSAKGARHMTQKPIRFEPTDRRIRVEFADTIVADSAKAMLMCEPGHLPVYYLPLGDIRMDLMQRTNQSSLCPHKGPAAYWILTVDGRTAENALWAYPVPYDHAPPGIKDYAAFY